MELVTKEVWYGMVTVYWEYCISKNVSIDLQALKWNNGISKGQF